MLDAVVANLTCACLAPPQGDSRLAVFLRVQGQAQTRYSRKIFRNLSEALTALQKAGWIGLQPGSKKTGLTTIIFPLESFQERLRAAGATLDDIEQEEPETIILTRKEWGFADNPTMPGSTRWERRSTQSDYRDTGKTKKLRAEVARINRHLRTADIRFTGDEPVDTSKRVLRRYFTQPLGDNKPRFDLGGRLFGGWWQSLKRHQRRFIRIDGEPIADLDFKSLFPRLALLGMGHPQPEDGIDLYAVPGLEGHRDGVKAAVATLLFNDGPKRGLPAEVAAKLPAGWSIRRIRDTIHDHHPSLADCFERGLGLHLMWKESCILVYAALALNERGITALGMHDGIMVAASRADEAIAIMEKTAELHVLARLPVVRKELKGEET
ncbi:hypothetical protein [Faunimonas pinastri]|nr:hypothetical protein [Faunimonas pinastri]